MYSNQLKDIREHPYVSKIGVTHKELVSLSLQIGINIRYTSSTIRSLGIRFSYIKQLLNEVGITPSTGHIGHPPITISSKECIYGLQPRTRIHFEIKKVQEEYDKMVKEGQLNDFYLYRKGGLCRTNRVRIIRRLYENDGRVSIESLMKELTLTPYNFKRCVLKPMEQKKQIEIIGEEIILSEEMQNFWNKDTLKIWEEFILSPIYEPLFFLNPSIKRMKNDSTVSTSCIV
jgi:hypothetical protein